MDSGYRLGSTERRHESTPLDFTVLLGRAICIEAV